ncbi:Arylsulfatase [Polystyrenella longa]|uniref:Arylsulfatase n=1 Tax=Polystyrenella longa TaxID=2528007 RepID=A0A518CU92_9PLAN|nr:sulfatase-like hydrolase/transferase [Polystyrenella longa]QDU82796.1 Arylsulfatase [Polystyrenella longa]
MISRLSTTLACIGLATLSLFTSDLFAAGRPNVILILTDDQGSVDAHCYGATDLVTPALDQLAKEGTRFTQFYAAAPVCSPSRAGFLTGRVPQRAGVPGNVSSSHGHGGMPAEQVTIAEMFQQSGYRTAHVGKWHLGYDEETMPNSQGFDYSFGHMGGCIDNYSHFFYWHGPNRHDLWKNGEEIFRDGQFFPDLMVDEAKTFIQTEDDRPFFMYWAINVPHYPLQATEKWRKVYANLESPRDKYAAFVSTMDEKIGELLRYLDEQNLREETIIVYQSDHGHSTETRAFGGGGSAGPYRGAKFSLYEGGIRVPAIISWPGQLPEGAVRDQLATGCDWYPTILDLCGIPQPEHQLDGKSLTNLIRSEEAASPHDVFHWQQRDQWAVRKGNWKLIANPRDTSLPQEEQPNAPIEDRVLYDLSKDIGEQHNLVFQHADLVRELEQLHNSWSAELAGDKN